jgi:hypothetical protein
MNKLIGTLALYLSLHAASATVPPEVMRDLTDPRAGKMLTRVQSLPPPVQSALARIFVQKQLYLGNPDQPLGVELSLPGQPDFPGRRLIFAFESPNYYVVYFESGPPAIHASILVLNRSRQKSPRLVWGAADLHRPFAKDRPDLLRRIVSGRIFEHAGMIW